MAKKMIYVHYVRISFWQFLSGAKIGHCVSEDTSTATTRSERTVASVKAGGGTTPASLRTTRQHDNTITWIVAVIASSCGVQKKIYNRRRQKRKCCTYTTINGNAFFGCDSDQLIHELTLANGSI